jgi:hypothetical protein
VGGINRRGTTHNSDTGETAAQQGPNLVPVNRNLNVDNLPRLDIKLQCSIR